MDDLPALEALLPHVRETIGLELEVSDLRGMGYPIAFHLAMWLAKRARGLVDVDHGEWWDPESYDRP